MIFDLDYFRARLKVNKHNLDNELELQADHLEKVGREVAYAARREAAAKQAFESAEARLIREACQEDPKLSHAKASTDIKVRREWKEAHDKLLDAKQNLAEWEALEKGWYNRGFDLKALGELFIGQYFTITEVSGPVRTEVNTPDLRRSMREATGSDFIDRVKSRATRNGKADQADDQPRRRRSLDE